MIEGSDNNGKESVMGMNESRKNKGSDESSGQCRWALRASSIHSSAVTDASSYNLHLRLRSVNSEEHSMPQWVKVPHFLCVSLAL